MQASIDNIRVTTGPVITTVALNLAAAGSTTLQLVNLQTNSAIQWQFNGTDIANATNATLELSSVATNHSGSYRAWSPLAPRWSPPTRAPCGFSTS